MHDEELIGKLYQQIGQLSTECEWLKKNLSYTAHPYYGSRRMIRELADYGYHVGRDKVRSCYQMLGCSMAMHIWLL